MGGVDEGCVWSGWKLEGLGVGRLDLEEKEDEEANVAQKTWPGHGNQIINETKKKKV